jgi:hypothetical protein
VDILNGYFFRHIFLIGNGDIITWVELWVFYGKRMGFNAILE